MSPSLLFSPYLQILAVPVLAMGHVRVLQRSNRALFCMKLANSWTWKPPKRREKSCKSQLP
jgi:hypothetical protein